jgi:hypothetical protein
VRALDAQALTGNPDDAGRPGGQDLRAGTLGCSCPEEVFDRIEVDAGAGEISHTDPDRRTTAGVHPGCQPHVGHCQAVAIALQEGVRERDRDHFNRLRLVVVSPRPERIAETVQAAFSGSPARDEKTHLHVLETGDVGFT